MKTTVVVEVEAHVSDLVEVFPCEEGLVSSEALQQSWESLRLLALLPGRAAAVPLQRVVDDVVVVGVFPRQDAGSTRAAERTGNKLRNRSKMDKIS